MEKEIRMASKLYECRDTAKALAKMQERNYTEMLAPYTHIIKQVMSANGLDELQALLRISKTKTYEENGMAQLLYMAAVVEIIEPSNT